MHVLNIDMYQTLAFAVGVLFIGGFLKKKISILEKFCIPAPVIGGLIFALVSCLLYVFGIVEFNFDETLKNVCMVMLSNRSVCRSAWYHSVSRSFIIRPQSAFVGLAS